MENTTRQNNTSGQGKAVEIPAEIRGWNWGAFFLTWIWGIGNNTYRAFWVFFPIVNFFMLIFLGIKGNEWAWRHKKWQSVEHFKAVQKKWSIAGLIFFIAMIVLVALIAFGLFSGINKLFKSSEAYKISLAQVSQSADFMTQVGKPYKTGFVSGNMQVSGPQGYANLAYTIKGPQGNARVLVKAEKAMNQWSIECLSVDYTRSNTRVDLVSCH
jgi:hypothetical protein